MSRQTIGLRSERQGSSGWRPDPHAEEDGPVVVSPRAVIPKLPLALLLAATWLWMQSTSLYEGAIAVARLRLESPAFPLEVGTSGKWAPDWSSWEEWKGEPMLYATGTTRTDRGRSGPFSIQLRVSPRDSVSGPWSTTTDAEGWIAAESNSNWSSPIRLDAHRTQSIEYRIPYAVQGPAASGSLLIGGSNDEIVLEHAHLNRSIAKAFLLFVMLPIGIWLGVSWRKRWKAARV